MALTFQQKQIERELLRFIDSSPDPIEACAVLLGRLAIAAPDVVRSEIAAIYRRRAQQPR